MQNNINSEKNINNINSENNLYSHQGYNPHLIEPKIQQDWQNKNAYRVVEDDKKPKFYACSMLPYPSGKLHMGHVRNYTINDVMARFLRMKGYNVLMPMGWDAFGMPAENAAIANKISPHAWTQQNIQDMKQQMHPLGLAIDWSRELSTCEPEYYRWNQWFFLKMREAGIAYRKSGIVNWDPVDQTVLANEQVIDGKGWRSGAVVEKREIPMYYLNITKYADELIEDLDDLGWPERVKIMQRNWIGKSAGVRLAFTHNINAEKHAEKLWVFTTRPDTLMGVTFCAIAPTHPIANYLLSKNAENPESQKTQSELKDFIDACAQGGVMEAQIASLEKKGIFTGMYVQHPITGEDVPLWIGNYVLMSYGEGAVMGVPAHDERDFHFAKTYDLPIKQVISSIHINNKVEQVFSENAWCEWYGEKSNDKQKNICINSDFLNGLDFEQAFTKIVEVLNAKGLGDKQETYRLRDWGISRQRYWGTPIPIIHCADCGEVPVPEKDLPVVLPTHLMPDGGGNILARTPEFYHTTCPQCGKPAHRETDTMDTFVDSSWYFMRYACPDAGTMVDERTDYWLPMDQYIGGIEHAILHLLYARFWTKVMRDMGLVKYDEPFKNLLTQGMVLNDSFYQEAANGKKTWFYPEEVEIELDDKGRTIAAKLKTTGEAVCLGGVEKMSKSKNNVVEPKTLIQQYGVDTARLFTIFAAPAEQSLEWNAHAVEGSYRYLKRVWNFAHQFKDSFGNIFKDSAINLNNFKDLNSTQQKIRFETHTILKQALFDYERLQYNTIVSAAMKLLNALEDFYKINIINNNVNNNIDLEKNILVLNEGLQILIKILYPIVPHITSELWQILDYNINNIELLDAPLPIVDEQALQQANLNLVLQINGKTKSQIDIASTASQAEIEAAAKQATLAFLQKTQVDLTEDAFAAILLKIVIVPKRLVNVVIKN